MNNYIKIFMFIVIININSKEVIMFSPYSISNLNINGYSTFLEDLTLNNISIVINKSLFINNDTYLNQENNKIEFNSNHIYIENLSENFLGKNFLTLDKNNNLCILKNEFIDLLQTQDSYDIVYVTNIIGRNNTPLKIGNASQNTITFGDNISSDINIYSDNTLFQGAIDTINNQPLNISKDLYSSSSLNIINNDFIINENITSDIIKFNSPITYFNPFLCSNITINAITTIGNNNNTISILQANCILNFENHNITFIGLPLLDRNISQDELNLFCLSYNNKLFKQQCEKINEIDSINNNLIINANNNISIESFFYTIIFNGKELILNNINIQNTLENFSFDFPISFQTNNQNEITQLIFNDDLFINDLNKINNLFCSSNLNSITIINQNNIENNTVFYDNQQIVFLNTKNMDFNLSPRIAIDINNIIGIEEQTKIKYKNTIYYKIDIIKERISKIKEKNKILSNEIESMNNIKKKLNIKNLNKKLSEEITNFIN